MFIKRFVVKSLPQVMGMVRQELGSDAIILSSRKIRRPGFAGWLGFTVYEVFAAVEPPSSTQTTPSTFTQAPLAPAQIPLHKMEKHDEPKQNVVQELQQIKNMLSSMLFEGLATPLAFDSEWQDVLIHWSKTGFSTELLHKLVDQFTERRSHEPDISLQKVLDEFLVSVLSKIGSCRTITVSDRLVLFVGSTGVGKTTTIAKLAAQAKLRDGRRVGLVTIDTFRVAAKEQLQTYADILNVPLKVAHNASELKEQIAALADCDLILVDTMGRSFLDAKQAQELQQLVHGITFDVTYLVVSLTSRFAEAKETAVVLQNIGCNALLLTKNDEALLPSLAVTLVDELNIPLSYITTGQEVPNDLMVADVEHMTSLFQGGMIIGRPSGDAAANHPATAGTNEA